MSDYVKLAEGYEKKKQSLKANFISKLDKIYKQRCYRKGSIVSAITELQDEQTIVETEIKDIEILMNQGD